MTMNDAVLLLADQGKDLYGQTILELWVEAQLVALLGNTLDVIIGLAVNTLC